MLLSLGAYGGGYLTGTLQYSTSFRSGQSLTFGARASTTGDKSSLALNSIILTRSPDIHARYVG